MIFVDVTSRFLNAGEDAERRQAGVGDRRPGKVEPSQIRELSQMRKPRIAHRRVLEVDMGQTLEFG